jgi:hypothetical protein
MIKWLVKIIDQPGAAEIYCAMDLKAKILYDQNRAEYEKKALAMVKEYSCPCLNRSLILLKFAANQMILTQLDFDSAKTNQLPLSSSLKQYLNSPFDEKYLGQSKSSEGGTLFPQAEV